MKRRVVHKKRATGTPSRPSGTLSNAAPAKKPAATASVVQKPPTRNINKSVSETADRHAQHQTHGSSVSQNTTARATAAAGGTSTQPSTATPNVDNLSHNNEIDRGSEPAAYTFQLAKYVAPNVRVRNAQELYQRACARPALIPAIPPLYLYFSGSEYLQIFLSQGGQYADPSLCPASSRRARMVTVVPPQRIGTKHSAKGVPMIAFRAANGTPGPYLRDILQINNAEPRPAVFTQVEDGTEIVLDTTEADHFLKIEWPLTLNPVPMKITYSDGKAAMTRRNLALYIASHLRHLASMYPKTVHPTSLSNMHIFALKNVPLSHLRLFSLEKQEGNIWLPVLGLDIPLDSRSIYEMWRPANK